MIVAHIIALHEMGSNNPDGVEIKQKLGPSGHPLDGIPFHPYYTVKDTLGAAMFLIVFAIIMFFMPEFGGYFRLSGAPGYDAGQETGSFEWLVRPLHRSQHDEPAKASRAGIDLATLTRLYHQGVHASSSPLINNFLYRLPQAFLAWHPEYPQFRTGADDWLARRDAVSLDRYTGLLERRSAFLGYS